MNPLFLRPVETNRTTQQFGENAVCCRTHPGGIPVIPFVLKDKVGATCPAGWRDLYKALALKGHNGVDLAAWYGEPGYHSALYKGWGRFSYDKSKALNVDVVSREPILACTEGCPAGTMHHIYVRYSHCSKHFISSQDAGVEPGTHIFASGNSGGATATHVHWAPKWCDADGKDLHKDNGWNGAFDPNPLYKNEFIIDHLKAVIPPAPIVKPNEPQPETPNLPITPPEPVPLTLSELVKRFFFNLLLRIS